MVSFIFVTQRCQTAVNETVNEAMSVIMTLDGAGQQTFHSDTTEDNTDCSITAQLSTYFSQMLT